VPTVAQVRIELWHSLASLLRSYTAAHGLHHGRNAETEADDEHLTVRHGARFLELRRSGASITWRREDGSTGMFEMTDHGTLRGPAAEEELDTAAEAWARELMV
jgi:hypothetical protein